MSRQENYFHPVVDLLSDEIKKQLTDHFLKFEKEHVHFKDGIDTSEFYEKYKTLGYKDAGAPYDIVKTNIDTVITHSINWNARKHLINFYLDNNDLTLPNNKFKENLNRAVRDYEVQQQSDKKVLDESYGDASTLFHKVGVNPKMFENCALIESVRNLYGGEHAGFLKAKAGGRALTKHIDPARKCVATFPLFPDYSEYRSCNYYETLNSEMPIHVVNYRNIRKPMLLNVQKVHDIGDELSKKESLCFQLEWNNLDYKQVRKMFSEKGLLTTSV